MLAHRFVSEYNSRGHDCKIGYVGPDLIAEVDGIEIPGFFMDAKAAHGGIERHIDFIEKERAKNATSPRN